MTAERERDDIRRDPCAGADRDTLDLAECEAREVEDGEISSEDSGESSFLDRFIPAAPPKSARSLKG